MTIELRHPARAEVVVAGPRATAAAIRNALSGEDVQVVEREWNAPGEAAAWERPDLVVLHANADRDVREQVGYLRRRWPTLHVVVVNVPTVAAALELMNAGADDAVAHPTSTFRARLRATARRVNAMNASTRIAVGDIVYEREAHRVWCAGHEVEMSPRELAVLDCLFWKAPDVVSADSLADFVWGDASIKARRGVVEVYISYLRRKLASSEQVVIGTVRGAGYRFEERARAD